MADTSRIEELKRRVQRDPASIAFAALADEYRRAGLFHDAIETCRAGLQRHPAYLSARVTLGRALIEIGEYTEARDHLEQVLRSAPENLAAIRALADIHRRTGERHDQIPALDTPSAGPPAEPARPALKLVTPSADTVPAARPVPVVAPLVPEPEARVSAAPGRTSLMIEDLERFLAGIQNARQLLQQD